MKKYLFTSESVSEGHPDKMADQISDAILDEILKQDLNARVACETYIKSGTILIGGEITSFASVDIEKIIKKTIREIGYTHPNTGFDVESCSIFTLISKQSKDISRGINHKNLFRQGAGDQGIMFGYATNETDVLMPIPITYAHRLMIRQSELRKNHTLPWILPDAKSQITFVYENNQVVGVDTVVFSTQHSEDISLSQLREAVMEEIIKPILPKSWLGKNTKYFINPTGRFVVGGPIGDCGLTGRKIIVDTYGGIARHGGGAFSGKDPSKMDRSASYAARYVAKNIVAAGLAERCEIQVSYAIGIAEPISISIETFGTEKIPLKRLDILVKKFFDLRPYGIIKMLNMLQPIYKKTAVYGHFGRKFFPWERTNKAEILKEAAGL